MAAGSTPAGRAMLICNKKDKFMMPDKFSLKKQKKFAILTKDKEVLELGGSAGEFVSLCKPLAKNIISIDIQPFSPDVKKADIISFLKKNKKKFGVIYARHIIEHFEHEDVLFIFQKSFKILHREGLLILVFPNTKNINVATYDFWVEFEHKRPYSDIGIIFQLEKIGFKIIKKGPDNDSWDNSLYKKILRKIRHLITGIDYEAPDYFIIAQKP